MKMPRAHLGHQDSTATVCEEPSPSIGACVRTRRKRRDLSEQDLASLLGVLEQEIIDIEEGKRTLAAIELVKIAEAFDIDVEHLVTPFKLNENRKFLRGRMKVRRRCSPLSLASIWPTG